jgi:curved DNA-binding protein
VIFVTIITIYAISPPLLLPSLLTRLMDYKNYYKILEINKDATADEIKKAYRKLAVKYHPDKNPNDKIAEEKFKEANEANNVLGDPDKRKKYDDLGDNWQFNQQANQQQNYNSSGRTNRAYNNENGQQFQESEFSDFFENMFGGKFSRGNSAQQRTYKGEDYNAELNVSFEEVYKGTSRQIEFDNQKLQLKIKPGIKNGQVLRLKGKGSKGINGGQDGDLYITAHVLENSVYKRKEDDLYCEINIDLYTAILGGFTVIKTLCNDIKMDISKETDNGKVLRLKGMGMPKYDKENEFGDLYAKVNIILPKNLVPKEIELFKELSLINNMTNAKSK